MPKRDSKFLIAVRAIDDTRSRDKGDFRFLLIKSDSNSSYLDNDKDKEERQYDSY